MKCRKIMDAPAASYIYWFNLMILPPLGVYGRQKRHYTRDCFPYCFRNFYCWYPLLYIQIDSILSSRKIHKKKNN